MTFNKLAGLAAALLCAGAASAQQLGRRGDCCSGYICLYPCDRTDFHPDAIFDVGIEVHTVQAGPEAAAYAQFLSGTGLSFEQALAEKPTITVTGPDGKIVFDGSAAPEVAGPYNFTLSSDMFHALNDKEDVVVEAKNYYWRDQNFLPAPGDYKVTASHLGKEYQVTWHVLASRRSEASAKAKNVILFIADGTTTAMWTAARLISKTQSYGKYDDHLAHDTLPYTGLLSTQGLDSLITDSANSASAYNAGQKSSTNALGVFPDNSPSDEDDPKQELFAEFVKRKLNFGVGIVTTTELSDATPAAVCGHNRRRGNKPELMYQCLQTLKPDVMLGGGGSTFKKKVGDKVVYDAYKEAGYAFVHTQKDLEAYVAKGDFSQPLLGVFHDSNMDIWLDRHVFPDNVKNQMNPAPEGGEGFDGTLAPDLAVMAKAAIDILSKTHPQGFYLMVETGSSDKQMHALDFHRALVEVLQQDASLKEALKFAQSRPEADTLILSTADHGHGFDVFGSVDTQLFNSVSEADAATKRGAVGVYDHAGHLSYKDADGDGFPDNLGDPASLRFTLACAANNGPDIVETYQTFPKPRGQAKVEIGANGDASSPGGEFTYQFGAGANTNFPSLGGSIVTAPDVHDHHANGGVPRNGNLGFSEGSGVHTLQDVPIFGYGPGAELISGWHENVDVFFVMADAVGLLPPGEGRKATNAIADATAALAEASSSGSSGGGLSVGAIAGIGVGCAVVGLIIGISIGRPMGKKSALSNESTISMSEK